MLARIRIRFTRINYYCNTFIVEVTDARKILEKENLNLKRGLGSNDNVGIYPCDLSYKTFYGRNLISERSKLEGL